MNANQTQGRNGSRKAMEAIRLAHYAGVQRQMERQGDHNENLRQAINAESVQGLSGTEGEELGSNFSIDSPSTVNNYFDAGEPKKPKSGLLKLAAGVALIATGAALPGGVALVSDALSSRTETAAPVVIKKEKRTEPKEDERSEYFLDLGD